MLRGGAGGQDLLRPRPRRPLHRGDHHHHGPRIRVASRRGCLRRPTDPDLHRRQAVQAAQPATGTIDSLHRHPGDRGELPQRPLPHVSAAASTRPASTRARCRPPRSTPSTKPPPPPSAPTTPPWCSACPSTKATAPRPPSRSPPGRHHRPGDWGSGRTGFGTALVLSDAAADYRAVIAPTSQYQVFVNCAGGNYADVIIRDLFGYGPDGATAGLQDAEKSRGINATLSGVVLKGRSQTITSGPDGLSLHPRRTRGSEPYAARTLSPPGADASCLTRCPVPRRTVRRGTGHGRCPADRTPARRGHRAFVSRSRWRRCAERPGQKWRSG